MIPLNLTLSGLYSYQQPQTIDFTRLTEASIFGIFGTVGSGKSTILEAISYALYGETERLNNRENRGYNMMNLKSNELLIDFIFRAGESNEEYRFKVAGKRNKNSFEKITTFERTAYRKEESAWVPIEADAEKIIGLSYQNFRRTIIIPQGKFQDFLQLTDAERTRMMKELFNLDKFELFHKITGLERKNSEERLRLEDRITQLGEIDPSQVEAFRESLQQLQRLIEANAQLVLEKQQVEAAFSQLKELFERVKVQEENLRKLQEREDEFRTLEEQVRQFDYCRLHFSHLLESQRQNTREIEKTTDNLQNRKARLHEITAALAREEATFNRIARQYSQREILKRQAEELEKVADIIELKAEEEKLAERISNAEMYESKAANALGQLQYEQETVIQTIKSLRLSQPDLATLSAVSNWFTLYGQLRAVQTSLNEEESENKRKLALLYDRKEKWLTQELKSLVPNATKELSIAQLESECKKVGLRLKKTQETLDHELQHLLLQRELETYASGLQPGAPCPLCGSTAHPQKLDATQVSQILAEKQDRKRQLQTSQDLLEQSEQQLNVLGVQLANQQEVIDSLEQKRQVHEAKVLAHRRTFVWDSFGPEDEAKVKQAFSEAESLKRQIEQQERIAETLKEKLLREEGNKTRFTQDIAKLRAEKEGKAGQIRQLFSQLTAINPGEYIYRQPRQLREESKQLQNRYAKLEEEYRTWEKALSTLKIDVGTLNGNIQSLEENIRYYQQLASELGEKIQDQLTSSSFNSLDEVRQLLALALDVEGEKKRVEGFRLQVHTAEAQFQSLVDQARGKRYDAQAHFQLQGEITRLKSEQNAQKREAAVLEHRITQLEKDLALRKDLLKRLDGLQQRGEDIQTLKKMFTASGFVNYVSTVYLQNLCQAANERFYKLTRQKLKLEVTDKNDFQVRDFLHNGQVRSVKTLSGGQTFQAALCLALALADNIGQLTQASQNFFFLDEGFGSLDKESLAIVFDTLKALRKENRIVGVISHVEEMQHEIDTYLRITNDEVTGSMVKTSWS